MDAQKNPPIHVAAAAGCKSDVINLCMDSRLVNATNSSGWTPIMYGAYYGHMDVVNALLSLGADVNLTNKFGGCLYTLAAVSGNVDIIRSLHCHHGITSEKIAKSLSTAVVFGHLSIVRFLIDNGADPNSPMENSGVVPLMLAVVENHVEIVKFLVLRGADISYQNLAGYSALQLARITGNQTILSFFLERLGNGFESVPTYPSCKNKEAVMQAARSGDLFRLKSLLSDNPSLSTSQHWMTSLNEEDAHSFGDDDVFESFENEEGHSNQKQSNLFHFKLSASGSRHDEINRASPIEDSHISANCLNKQLPSNLLIMDSEPKMSNVSKSEGEGRVASPLILACFNGHVEAARLLIAAGADPNRQRNGRTPLMLAAITSNMELVKLLLCVGADPMVESRIDRLTAFELATLSGADTEILRLIAFYTMPVSTDVSRDAMSLQMKCPPVKFDCWNTPQRILAKLQSFVSPRLQNDMCYLDSQSFSSAKGSKKWPSPLRKIRKSPRMKARRLFSTPVTCISSGVELPFDNSQRWKNAFPKSSKNVSDVNFNFRSSSRPFDTPFESLSSDIIHNVKPPNYLRSCEMNIIGEINHEKNEPNCYKHTLLEQHEGTINGKNSMLTLLESPLHFTREVPQLMSDTKTHDPMDKRDSVPSINVSTHLKLSTHGKESFEDYIEKHDLKEYLPLFRNNEVTEIDVILTVTDGDLREMGVMSPQERKHILKKIHGQCSFQWNL